MDKILIKIEAEEYNAQARSLAERIGADVVDLGYEPDDSETVIRFSAEGVFLRKGDIETQGDFSKLLRRTENGKVLHEQIVKAAKLKGAVDMPLVVDATAGLGEDAFLLAAAGYEVIMYERDPVIAVMLADALKRAKESASTAEAEIACRMSLIKEDSITALKNLGRRADIVLLDPMFPERTKSSLVKKKFQIIHVLEKPCTDEEELLSAAISARPRKILVKRPLKAPFLAGKKPSHSITGKTIRYDVFVFPEN